MEVIAVCGVSFMSADKTHMSKTREETVRATVISDNAHDLLRLGSRDRWGRCTVYLEKSLAEDEPAQDLQYVVLSSASLIRLLGPQSFVALSKQKSSLTSHSMATGDGHWLANV